MSHHMITVPITKIGDLNLTFSMSVGSRTQAYDRPITYKPAHTFNDKTEGTFEFGRSFPSIGFSYYKDAQHHGYIKFDDFKKYKLQTALQQVIMQILNDQHGLETSIYIYDPETTELQINEKTKDEYNVHCDGLFNQSMDIRPAVGESGEEVIEFIIGNICMFRMTMDEAEFLYYTLESTNMLEIKLMVFNLYLQIIQLKGGCLASIVKMDNIVAERRSKEAIDLERTRVLSSQEYVSEPDPEIKNQGNFSKFYDHNRRNET